MDDGSLIYTHLSPIGLFFV